MLCTHRGSRPVSPERRSRRTVSPCSLVRAGPKAFDCARPYHGELAGLDLSDQHAVCRAVPPEVKNLLDLGDVAIKRTKQHFPHGPGNLQDTLHASGLQSYRNVINQRFSSFASRWEPRDEREAVAREAASALATGGGNCGEYARVAATELNLLLPHGTPIRVCNLTNADHVLVMVGNHLHDDPENSVIVDAWPSRAQAVCAMDYELFDLSSLHTVQSFVADGDDLLIGMAQRVRNWRGDRAAEAPLLPWEDLPLFSTVVDYWSVSHVTRNNARISYSADAQGLYRTQPEKDRFSARVDGVLRSGTAFSQQFLQDRFNYHFVQLHHGLRLGYVNPRYAHDSPTDEPCSLSRLCVAKRVGESWRPTSWSRFGGPQTYHLETQWGVVDSIVRGLIERAQLPDAWNRVLTCEKAATTDSLTRYDPSRPIAQQVYHQAGRASDLLLDDNLVVELRSFGFGFGDALDDSTTVTMSLLKYGDGVVEAQNLDFFGSRGSSVTRETTVRELDLLLPYLAGLAALHQPR